LRFIERLSPELGGIIGVFSLKAITTALSFALVLLAARTLGAGEFGTYSMLFSAAGLLSVGGTFGQHVLLMRSWSEFSASNRPDLLKGSLIYGSVTLGTGTAVAVALFFLWCASAYGRELATVVALYLASLSVLMGTAHLVRSAVGIRAGDGWGYILPLAPAVAYLTLCMANGEHADLPALFGIMAAGAIVAIAVHFIMIRRAAIGRFPAFWTIAASFDTSTWTARSLKLWMSSGLEAANQYIDVLIIGLVLSPEAAGVYFVLTRLANILAVGADAIHMYATRHLPAHFYAKEYARLNGLLDATAWATLVVALCGILAIAVGGHLLLMAFGAEYAPYHAALLVLSCGVAAAISAGPSGSILMLTGHEGRYLSITAGTVLLRVIAMLALIPWFGAYGGVMASTASISLMALLLVVSARALTGLDGSILRLLPQFRHINIQKPLSFANPGVAPVAEAAYADGPNRPHLGNGER
jgi:O-antigen/teichoic acid export membrane protein